MIIILIWSELVEVAHRQSQYYNLCSNRTIAFFAFENRSVHQMRIIFNLFIHKTLNNSNRSNTRVTLSTYLGEDTIAHSGTNLCPSGMSKLWGWVQATATRRTSRGASVPAAVQCLFTIYACWWAAGRVQGCLLPKLKLNIKVMIMLK